MIRVNRLRNVAAALPVLFVISWSSTQFSVLDVV
jgi:hypothetical protein